MSERLSGACLCGAIAYELEGDPIDAGFCHCRLCQRSSGAPVVAWGTWRWDCLHVLRGEPRVFRSSAKGERKFCEACGTQLLFVHQDAPLLVDVTLASLDEPERVVPHYHIWRMSRISWLETADTLPRHDDDGPDRETMLRS